MTGRKAFEGESPASVIAAILERDPSPTSTVQSRHVLERPEDPAFAGQARAFASA